MKSNVNFFHKLLYFFLALYNNLRKTANVVNQLLTATVPCATIDRFGIGKKEFLDFPTVPDVDEKSETKAGKIFKFLSSATGIAIITLLGCFIVSLTLVLYLFVALRNALVTRRFMKSEIKRLLKDIKEMEMLIPEPKKTTFLKSIPNPTIGTKVESASPSGGVVTVKETPVKPKRNETAATPPKNETAPKPTKKI